MSSLSSVQIRDNEECFFCKDTFTEDDYKNDNPPMKHGGRGLLHDPGHKLCWKQVSQYWDKCPFCEDSLNYNSLFSWVERLQEIPRKYLANASITVLTVLATDAGLTAIAPDGENALSRALSVLTTLGHMDAPWHGGWHGRLFKLLGGLRYAMDVGLSWIDPDRSWTDPARTLLPIPIILLLNLMISKIPGGNKDAVYLGLSTAGFLIRFLDISAESAALIGGGLVSGVFAVIRDYL